MSEATPPPLQVLRRSPLQVLRRLCDLAEQAKSGEISDDILRAEVVNLVDRNVRPIVELVARQQQAALPGLMQNAPDREPDGPDGSRKVASTFSPDLVATTEPIGIGQATFGHRLRMLDLTGKRCILFARANVAQQVGKMMEQIDRLRRFATTEGVVVVDEVRLEGVIGSKTLRCLDALIERKKKENDFDMLVAVHPDRLARSPHGYMMLQLLNYAGIQLTFLEGGPFVVG